MPIVIGSRSAEKARRPPPTRCRRSRAAAAARRQQCRRRQGGRGGARHGALGEPGADPRRDRARTSPASWWSTPPCRWCRRRVARVQLPPEGSAALAAQKRLGAGVRVVAAFHNVAAHKLQTDEPIDCDVLVFGDDPKDREIVVGAGRGGRAARHPRRPARQLGGGRGADLGADRHQPQLQGRRRRHPHHRHRRAREHGAAGGSGLAMRATGTSLSRSRLTITALDGIPQVAARRRPGALLIAALERNGVTLRARDIVVVTSKIVSKAEGRYLDLAAVEPSERARELAADHRQGRAAGRGDPVARRPRWSAPSPTC